jgi:WD repeat-containing protein 23
VYDVVQKRVVYAAEAHDDDINTVAFADATGKSDVFYTGSDDNLIKVWDRRLLGSGSREPAGVLCGHTEGITFLDSKGDGRYLVSNSKDQTAKLWDIRAMRSNDDYKSLTQMPSRYRWDYRVLPYPGTQSPHLHPHDSSIMTYRGHKVLETLIRCYFSPMETTNQRYIYSGSRDGSVHIYDALTGETVAKREIHDAAVRDVNWHPYKMELCSSSWDGTIVKSLPLAAGQKEGANSSRFRERFIDDDFHGARQHDDSDDSDDY